MTLNVRKVSLEDLARELEEGVGKKPIETETGKRYEGRKP